MKTARLSTTRSVALVGPAVFFVVVTLVACASETRVPFAASDSGTPTEPLPVPTTSSTQITPPPDKPVVDGGPPDDCKRAAPSNVCGVVPQCGCASTHTCDVTDSKGTTGCITAGNASMGSPCTATAGCALGLTCIFGTCHAFCDDPTTPCTQAGTGACAQIKTKAADAAVPNLAICRVVCALEDPTSCGGKTNAGTGVCFYDSAGGTDCQSGGSRTENQTCSPTEECGPGLICLTGTNATRTCKRWCRVGQNDCGVGKTCNGLQTPVKIGTVEYGGCP